MQFNQNSNNEDMNKSEMLRAQIRQPVYVYKQDSGNMIKK